MPTTIAAAAPRYVYAAYCPYGVASDASTGEAIRTITRFATEAERAAWLDAGGGYRSQPNYRYAVRASQITAAERRCLAESDGSPAMDAAPLGRDGYSTWGNG